MLLTGRDHELEVLDRAVADVRAGTPRVLALVGEAGIGKSALLGALEQRAGAAGMLVLAGRAADHERDVPFGVVIDALDEHVATLHPRRLDAVGHELAAVLPSAGAGAAPACTTIGAAERFRVHRALRGLLELLARERPVALLLDDLHWADPASLELVLHLLRRPADAPVLLVLALRPHEVAARLLDAGRAAPGWEHLALGPLRRDAALALLEGVGDEAARARLADEAAGNPLFLRELARVAPAGDGALPATVQAAVAVELARLPEDACELLEGAAVAGDPFDAEVAAAAAGVELHDALGRLDALVAADLVRPARDELGARAFAFRHPIVRRAVRDAMPPGRRLAAHERAAAALAVQGAPATRRAYHVAQSARPGDAAAVALLREAAEHSVRTSPASAARWYAAALRLAPATDAPGRAELLAPMAHALADAGRIAEARDTVDEAVALLPEGAGCRYELQALATTLEQVLDRHEAADRRLAAALRGAPPAAEARLALAGAAGAFKNHDGAGMVAWAERVLRAAPDDERAVRLAGVAAEALGRSWLGQSARAAALLDEAHAGIGRLGDDELAGCLDTAQYVALGLLFGERYREAVGVAARGVELARATGRSRLLPMIAGLAGLASFNLGEMDAALPWCEAAEDAARAHGASSHLFNALWLRVQLHDHRGEPAEAARAADEVRRMLPAMRDGSTTRVARGVLAALVAEDDPAEAVELLTADGGAFAPGEPAWTMWLLPVLVRAAIAAGRVEDAERFAERATERAEALGLAASKVRVATARAEVLLARGDAHAAAAVAAQAVAAAETAPAPFDGIVARITLGRALGATGDRPGGVAVLQRATEDAARGRIVKLHDAAARELRRLGTRVGAGARRAAGAAGTGELTARERDVAELVARGRTNREAAAALFLSEKTIEHHLSRVYAKLGVRSRVELSRLIEVAA